MMQGYTAAIYNLKVLADFLTRVLGQILLVLDGMAIMMVILVRADEHSPPTCPHTMVPKKMMTLLVTS